MIATKYMEVSMTSNMLQKYFFPFHFLEEVAPLLSSSASDLSIYEDDKAVFVEAPLPGLKPEEMDVTFQKGVLIIRGNKKEEEQDAQRKYYRKANRTFTYSVAIPGNIDESQEPKAEYKHGLIKITFMKQKKAEPKRISIQHG
jgi:HSP20 family protein